jgi:hypothetical protein
MVNDALTWMLSRQSVVDGGFGDNGTSSALETALAYLAINEVAGGAYAAELGEALGFLVAGQDADGSWGGDPFTTALALGTLPALAPGTLADSDGNGIPDEVETLLGEDPLVADRTGASGNGLAVEGSTVSQTLSGGDQYAGYSYTLPPGTGNPPYSWEIVSGFLPDGLSMNSGTGEISGTPDTSGTFNFTYQVNDAEGSQLIAAQITIAASTQSVKIPLLPPWALALMAIALILARRWSNGRRKIHRA